ncbi:MAG: sulfatase-like hydrolase/transferase [Succinivibrio sp.]|nr:sulfatase-like hydrolase/transferase [Succinivibrio sp.]
MTIKHRFAYIVWLALCGLPMLIFYAPMFAPEAEDVGLFCSVVYYIAAISTGVLGSLLFYALLILPTLIRPKLGILKFGYVMLIMALLFIGIGVDAHVYALYRFHMNYTMYDLLVNAKGQVIELSDETIKSIIVEVLAILACALLGTYFAVLFSNHFAWRKFIVLIILAFVGVNGVNVYASAVADQPLLEIGNRIPGYYPLTMNTKLIEWGLISRDLIAERKVSVRAEGRFYYPKHPLKYQELHSKPYNILFLVVDSLRFDMLTEQIMPNTYNLAQHNLHFTNYFSAGNSTRPGIFTLFYSIPSNYWFSAMQTGVRAAFVDALLQRGYKLGTFTSANLYKPEFNLTVFAGLKDLRLESQGETGWERDLDCIKDFIGFLDEPRTDPFFAFVFLDAPHAISKPDGAATPFMPELSKVNHLELNEHTDRTEYFNLYKNVSHWTDENIGRIYSELLKRELTEHTIIVITADHGQEFNDNKLNFWGHNGNYTPYQIKVPMVICWPGRGHEVIDKLATSYDVSVTLMQNVLGVTNAVQDYSVGQSLFDLKPLDFFLAGSYLENAVIEKDRIIMIDQAGMMHFKDWSWRDSQNVERSETIIKAIRQLSEFQVKPEDRP